MIIIKQAVEQMAKTYYESFYAGLVGHGQTSWDELSDSDKYRHIAAQRAAITLGLMNAYAAIAASGNGCPAVASEPTSGS